MQSNPFLKVRKLTKEFSHPDKKTVALNQISFDIMRGETLGLVGESGCGKSTVGRTLLQLYKPTSGQIALNGVELTTLKRKELKRIRRKLQIIFQDPYAALDPRMTIEDAIGEAIDIHRLAAGAKRERRINELLSLVGLDRNHKGRFPHEFSGGQRQRIVLARALAVDPAFIVLDEPLSALDVSIQAQIVNLLKKVQQERNLTYLFISHDLSAIRYLSDRIAVMYLGEIVEIAPAEALYKEPLHPYTEALLSAIPIPDPEKERNKKTIMLKPQQNSLQEDTVGCPFAPRCHRAIARCFSEKPKLKEVKSSRKSACHLF